MKTNDFSDQFTDLVRQWGQDCSSKHYDHFGLWLVETVKYTKNFELTATQPTGLFLTRLKANGKSYAGLLTGAAFDGQKFILTLYGPKRMTIHVNHSDLTAIYYEFQPRDGTVFVIENEELIKRAKEEPKKSGGGKQNVSPSKPAKLEEVLVL